MKQTLWSYVYQKERKTNKEREIERQKQQARKNDTRYIENTFWEIVMQYVLVISVVGFFTWLFWMMSWNSLSDDPSIGWRIWGSLCTMGALWTTYHFIDWCLTAVNEAIDIEAIKKATRESKNVAIYSDFLPTLLETQKTKILGESSEIKTVLSHIDTNLANAKKDRQELCVAIAQYDVKNESVPQHLLNLAETVTETIQIEEENRKRTEETIAKLQAAFAACENRIEQVKKPIQELRLAQRICEQNKSAKKHVEDAERAAMESVLQAKQTIFSLQELHSNKISKHAAQLCAHGAPSTETRQFLELVDGTIVKI